MTPAAKQRQYRQRLKLRRKPAAALESERQFGLMAARLDALAARLRAAPGELEAEVQGDVVRAVDSAVGLQGMLHPVVAADRLSGMADLLRLLMTVDDGDPEANA